jgi:hypothetical protein
LAATTTSSSTRPTTKSRSLVTVISVMILIGVEVFGVALAGGWALGGVLEQSDVVAYALMGLFSLFGLYIMVQLWHRAHAAEAGR